MNHAPSTRPLQTAKYGIMLIASMLHIARAYELSSRATPLMRSPHNLFRAPFIASATSGTSILGSKMSTPCFSRSLSSLEMAKPNNIICDNFYSISLSIPTMEMMEEVGALIAILSQPSDVMFLDGDLGAGKTTFSRGFIKCKLGVADDDCDDDENDTQENRTEELRITSPTYLLSNTYEYTEDDDYDEDEDREQKVME